MKKFRWQYILKLIVFTTLITLVAIDLGGAWLFVSALTGGPCDPFPDPPTTWGSYVDNTITTHDGRQLPVRYYPSQNGAAVIAMGGMDGAIGEALPYVEPLLEAGYGVLQVGGRRCAQPRTRVTLGYNEAFDATQVVAFLTEQPEVDPERIGIYGFSMGGVSSIRAAARSPEIKAVVAMGGYHNLGEDFVEGDREGQLGLPKWIFYHTIALVYRLQTGVDPWQSSPIDDLPKINPRPVLLIYGENEIVTNRGREQYNAALEPKELWVVPDAGHGDYHLAAPEEFGQRLVNFFDATLLGE